MHILFTMENLTKLVETIENCTTIQELEAAYTSATSRVLEMQAQGLWEGIANAEELCKTLNHIANYHIVRVCYIAYRQYEESGKTDRTAARDVLLCYDTIKEHSHNIVEKELLSGLCDEVTSFNRVF